MAAPTNSAIDEAVPPTGTPDRAKTNAVLKALAGDSSIQPTSGSVVRRTIENENFSGGRVKATPATDPEDCIIKAQFDAYVIEHLARRSAAAPLSSESTGSPGQWFADNDYVYFCIAPNAWRRAALGVWSE